MSQQADFSTTRINHRFYVALQTVSSSQRIWAAKRVIELTYSQITSEAQNKDSTCQDIAEGAALLATTTRKSTQRTATTRLRQWYTRLQWHSQVRGRVISELIKKQKLHLPTISGNISLQLTGRRSWVSRIASIDPSTRELKFYNIDHQDKQEGSILLCSVENAYLSSKEPKNVVLELGGETKVTIRCSTTLEARSWSNEFKEYVCGTSSTTTNEAGKIKNANIVTQVCDACGHEVDGSQVLLKVDGNGTLQAKKAGANFFCSNACVTLFERTLEKGYKIDNGKLTSSPSLPSPPPLSPPTTTTITENVKFQKRSTSIENNGILNKTPKQTKRKVSFGNLTLYKHERVPGGSLGVPSMGVPLGLGWKLLEKTKTTVDEFEKLRNGKDENDPINIIVDSDDDNSDENVSYSFHRDGRTPDYERLKILLDYGYKKSDFQTLLNDLKIIKDNRQNTARSRTGKMVMCGEDPDEVEKWEKDALNISTRSSKPSYPTKSSTTDSAKKIGSTLTHNPLNPMRKNVDISIGSRNPMSKPLGRPTSETLVSIDPVIEPTKLSKEQKKADKRAKKMLSKFGTKVNKVVGRGRGGIKKGKKKRTSDKAGKEKTTKTSISKKKSDTDVLISHTPPSCSDSITPGRPSSNSLVSVDQIIQDI